MAWTSPRTWISGELVTASLLNTHVRDNELYLKDAPTFDGNVTITGTTTHTGAVSCSSTLAVSGASTVAALTASGTVTPQGLVDASGASAGQIKFPASQNASTNANTLDDYEEGTWTPALGGSGGQSGQAYAIQVGKYVKIGKLVHAQFRLQLSALGTVTTSAIITGLPFNSENTTNLSSSLVVGRWANFSSSIVWLGGDIGPNSAQIALYLATAAAVSYTNVTQADLSNTAYLDGAISYVADA